MKVMPGDALAHTQDLAPNEPSPRSRSCGLPSGSLRICLRQRRGRRRSRLNDGPECDAKQDGNANKQHEYYGHQNTSGRRLSLHLDVMLFLVRVRARQRQAQSQQA